jgi:hypothetical protein
VPLLFMEGWLRDAETGRCRKTCTRINRTKKS